MQYVECNVLNDPNSNEYIYSSKKVDESANLCSVNDNDHLIVLPTEAGSSVVCTSKSVNHDDVKLVAVSFRRLFQHDRCESAKMANR